MLSREDGDNSKKNSRIIEKNTSEVKKLRKNYYLALALSAALLAGCSVDSGTANKTTAAAETTTAAAAETTAAATEAALPDGTYTADFNTDSSMFHANEACEGKGTLTVQNGKMTFHVSLVSKKIVNLYLGTAEDAAAHEDDWLQPTEDTVTYSDGLSDEVYGFDIPVEKLDTDFSLAILGEKGKWYDHVVSVANAEPAEAEAEGETSSSDAEETTNGAVGEAVDAASLADGSYTCSVTLEGGSGRASIESPAKLSVENGSITAEITWSSPNYDYMLVDGEKYLPVNTEGNSVFRIPATLDSALSVIGDTVAMSTPHEIQYTLTFDSSTLAAAED